MALPSSTASNNLVTQNLVSDISESACSKIRDMILQSIRDYDKEILQVRHKTIETNCQESSAAITEIRTQISDLSSRLAKAEKDNKELKKVNNDMAIKLESQKDDLRLHTELAESRYNSDRKLHEHHLFQTSQREQRARLHSIKIHNFQRPSHDGPITDDLVYHLLIDPVLRDAKARGKLRYLPSHQDEIIEKSHILKSDSNAVPSFIFCFYSRNILFAFMLNKRKQVELLKKEAETLPPSASYASAAKFKPGLHLRCSHSLSPLNSKTMFFLYRHPLVSKCKVAQLQVAFMLKRTKTWFLVRNPFAQDLLSMSLPMPTYPEIVHDIRSSNPLIFENDIPEDGLTLADFKMVPIDDSEDESSQGKNDEPQTIQVDTEDPPLGQAGSGPGGVISHFESQTASALKEAIRTARSPSPCSSSDQPPREDAKRPAQQSPEDRPAAKKPPNFRQQPKRGNNKKKSPKKRQ